MAEAGPTKGKIKFKIISPLAPIVECEVDSVLLPLISGETLILPRHAPLLSAVENGKIILKKGSEEEVYFVSKGIAEIRRDICAVCAWGIAQKDIHPNDIKNQIEELEKHLSSPHSEAEKQISQNLISFLKKIPSCLSN